MGNIFYNPPSAPAYNTRPAPFQPWHSFLVFYSINHKNITHMSKTLTVLLVGIGIGLLLAPDKGSNTLRKIRGKLDDLKDQASDKAGDYFQKGKSTLRTAGAKVNDILD
jgi:hypothetical protein